MLTHLHSRWFFCFQSSVFRNTKNYTMETGPWPNKKRLRPETGRSRKLRGTTHISAAIPRQRSLVCNGTTRSALLKHSLSHRQLRSEFVQHCSENLSAGEFSLWLQDRRPVYPSKPYTVSIFALWLPHYNTGTKPCQVSKPDCFCRLKWNFKFHSP